MRFFAEDLGRIRRGELTAALRPYEGRPLSFKPADRFHSGLYAIELVSETRTLVGSEGEPPLVLHHNPPKVVYERAVAKTDEYVEVTSRTRLPLCSLTEDSVEALGFEALAEVIDVFCTDHGGLEEQLVWLVDFRYATDLPRVLAWPHSGKAGHDDYVVNAGSPDALCAEPEGIESDLLNHWAATNRERHRDRRAHPGRDDEIRRLEAEIKGLRKRQTRTGISAALEIAVREHQIRDLRDERAAA